MRSWRRFVVYLGSRGFRLLVCVALLSEGLNAQGRGGRPIDIRQKGGATTAAPKTGAKVFGLPVVAPPPPEPESRYSFDFAPGYEAQKGAWSAGFGVTFNNDSLMSSIPFSVDALDQIISANGEHHNLLEVDALVTPFKQLRVGGVGIQPLLLGTISHEAGVASLQEGEIEVDATLVNNSTNALSLVLSGLGYFDRSAPVGGGGTTTGFTPGVAGELKWQLVRLQGEYDLNSDFAGEDAFVAKLLADFDWHGRTLTPSIAAKKHKVLQIGLSVNVPGMRRRPGMRRP